MKSTVINDRVNPLVADRAADKAESVEGIKTDEIEKLIPMTDWYNPSQLLDTAKKTAISTVIGENADPRLISPAPPDGSHFNYSKEFDANGEIQENAADRQEIWIDYVSDVGDGWNPTYSVAYALARERLEIAGEKLDRGEILIFGGDGVYPTANPDEYKKKLVLPYRMAFNASRCDAAANGGNGAVGGNVLKKNPHLFVLPGNHDWYDSLVAFQKLFCTSIFNERIFAGGWRTRQKRSYFALKLPQKWWLLGIDLQLSHNIDVPQLEYFKSVIGKMEAGDKVILCVPEPYWVKAIKYQDHDEAFDKFVEKEESIHKLEEILEAHQVQTKLYVAGDLHHYRRFESHDRDRIQKITAGGGGAFLHPTHDFDFEHKRRNKEIKDARRFDWKKNYPDRDVSSGLDWQHLNPLGFISRSPKFGFVTGILYALLALLIHGTLNTAFSWGGAMNATINRFIDEPLALIVVAAMIMGLIFFTDSNSKRYRRIAGAIHGFVHLTAVFFLGWWAYRVSQRLNNDFGAQINATLNAFYDAALGGWLGSAARVAPDTVLNLLWFFSVLFICGIGGYVVGSLIMSLYLFVSIHFFGRHDNEAFSALKIEDYKSFLRMHIDKDGTLTIYPIKIEKVGRQWNFKENNGCGYYEASAPLKPELIEEKPITI